MWASKTGSWGRLRCRGALLAYGRRSAAGRPILLTIPASEAGRRVEADLLPYDIRLAGDFFFAVENLTPMRGEVQFWLHARLLAHTLFRPASQAPWARRGVGASIAVDVRTDDRLRHGPDGAVVSVCFVCPVCFCVFARAGPDRWARPAGRSIAVRQVVRQFDARQFVVRPFDSR